MLAMRKAILLAGVLTLTMLLLPLSAAGSSVNLGPRSSTPDALSAPAPSATASTLTASPVTGSLGVPAADTGTAPSSWTGAATGLALEQRVMATAQADHLPLEAVSLPNLLGDSTVSNGVVTPLYTTAPAPMGIGTWGVENTTGTPQPYNITTQSWEGSVTFQNINTFLLDNDGTLSTNGSQNTFGVQLNAVTNDTTVGGTSTGAFWTQNVLYFNYPSPGTVTFLDNIWNFSSPSTSLTQGTLYSYNGTPVYPEYYYDFGPTFTISFPVTIDLYLNSSTTNLANGFGYTTIRFGFDIVDPQTGVSQDSGIYDTVMFNSTTPSASVPASPFLVDGSQVTPTGRLPYDAEIMIGGPGGGTTTSVYGVSGSESLRYWNSTLSAYANPSSAWNVGTDTGETSEGIAETYTTPGTVELNAGPSFPMPFWNATPGGNAGQATFAGPLSPSNAFVFFTPGRSFDVNLAAWAPTQTSSSVAYILPPGTYSIQAMLSEYGLVQTRASAGNGGHARLDLNLHYDPRAGVYTPLFAWDNAQLAAISSSGSGTSRSPYVLMNAPARGGIDPLFGEMNDYLYQVFPGVLLAGTTAHVDLLDPSLMQLTYPSGYQSSLTEFGLPITNNLQFEIFDASHVSIWHAEGITGWFFFEDYGPTGLLPLANVVIWGGSQDLVGDSTFVSQGSSLVLAGLDPSAPTDNVVWGNTFVNSSALSPEMYPGDGVTNGPPIGIFAFESGDWIYNNWVGTSITAYAPDVNMFTGAPQLNSENWNLSMVEPANYASSFNGFWLYGTIVPSRWQGGNYWADYVPGTALPYDEYGYIAAGGDYFPYPITAYTVDFTVNGLRFGSTWSVTLNGVTQTTDSNSLVFYETAGSYTFTASLLSGRGYLTPASGSLTVGTHNLHQILIWHP